MFGCRSALIGACAWALLACGGGPQSDYSQDQTPQTLVEIVPAINVCPVFDRSLITPLDIPPHLSAAVAVNATDPDGTDAALAYQWSTPYGSFSTPDRPTTAYRCAQLGPQVLTVTAQDVRGCSTHLALNVTCLAR